MWKLKKNRIYICKSVIAIINIDTMVFYFSNRYKSNYINCYLL